MLKYIWILNIILVLDISGVFTTTSSTLKRIKSSSTIKSVKNSNSNKNVPISTKSSKFNPKVLTTKNNIIIQKRSPNKIANSKTIKYFPNKTTINPGLTIEKYVVPTFKQFLLWSDVFFITTETKEPEEIFPADEGFILVTPKKVIVTKPTVFTKILTKATTVNKKPATKQHNKLSTNKLLAAKSNEVKVKTMKSSQPNVKIVHRRLLQTLEEPFIIPPCTNNIDCNKSNHEICETRDLRRECNCLAGYSRKDGADSECYAVKTFKVIIWFKIPYKEVFQEFDSPEYLEMAVMMINLLTKELNSSNYFIKVIVSHFWIYTNNQEPFTNGDAYLLFKNNEHTRKISSETLKNSLKSLANNSQIQKWEVKNPHDCEDIELNYCSPNAICDLNQKNHSVTCQCKSGYKDISELNNLPSGAECQAICTDDYCLNNGKCYVKDGKQDCRCQFWFIWNRCWLDFRIVLGCVAGCLLLTLVFVFLALWSYYNGKKYEEPYPSGRSQKAPPDRRSIVDRDQDRMDTVLYSDIPVTLFRRLQTEHQDSDNHNTEDLMKNFFPRAHL